MARLTKLKRERTKVRKMIEGRAGENGGGRAIAAFHKDHSARPRTTMNLL